MIVSTKTLMRFTCKIAVTSDCWLWLGSKDIRGYGAFRLQSYTSIRAHRLAWALANGIFPTQYICHACDNPSCVRPSHLFEGSQLDNVRDMHRKGRSRKATGNRHWSKLHPEKIVKGEHNGRAVLNVLQIKELRTLFAQGLTNISELARRFKIGRTQTKRILTGESWNFVT